MRRHRLSGLGKLTHSSLSLHHASLCISNASPLIILSQVLLLRMNLSILFVSSSLSCPLSLTHAIYLSSTELLDVGIVHVLLSGLFPLSESGFWPYREFIPWNRILFYSLWTFTIQLSVYPCEPPRMSKQFGTSRTNRQKLRRWVQTCCSGVRTRVSCGCFAV
jgi:hypothetical protein